MNKFKKLYMLSILLSVGLLIIFAGCDQTKETGAAPEQVERAAAFPVVKGPYMGQVPPGLTPEIFAPEIVSRRYSEFSSVFSRDGREFYFTISGTPYWVIAVMKQEEGRWSGPEVPPFSGKYSDCDPNLTPGGSKLFFSSRRPLEGSGPPKPDADIWYVTRTEDGWSEAVNAGPKINSEGNEYYAVFTKDGSLYFSSTREGGKGEADIYRSRWVNGRYEEPENIGEPVNSEFFEGDFFIDPEEKYIIVTIYGRSDTLGSGDLYISFADTDSWTPLKNMGEGVNSRYNEHCPMVSHDGKYFFFSSRRSQHKSHSETPLTYEDKIKILDSCGNGYTNEDIYWVDAGIINTLRNK